MIHSKQQNKYLVIGNPVQNSWSPRLHLEFAKQFEIDLQYKIYNVETTNYKQLLERFYKEGVHGINVTTPLKEHLLPWVDTATEQVNVCGAINTLTFENGLVHAANTDGVGFMRDLTQRHGVSLAGKNVLILGAGGAMRGILSYILAANPKAITIASRDINRASQILQMHTKQLHTNSKSTRVIGYPQLQHNHYDVVINTTNCGHKNYLPPVPENLILQNAVFYDLNYGSASVPFTVWLQHKKLHKIINGFGMLLEQAAESFYIWHKKRPNTDLIYI